MPIPVSRTTNSSAPASPRRPVRLTSPLGELERVVEQVEQDLPQPRGVADDRLIFHGNQGELRQPYREGQEDQLGALGFALNARVLWNAQYMDDAVVHLRATDHEIADEDLRRLSPLQHEHIELLGNFPSRCPTNFAAGQRHQLRGLGDRAWRTFLFRYHRKA
jgi:hypothetical protein